MPVIAYGEKWDVFPKEESQNLMNKNKSLYQVNNYAEWWLVLCLPEGPLWMDNINGEMAIERENDMLVTVF